MPQFVIDELGHVFILVCGFLLYQCTPKGWLGAGEDSVEEVVDAASKILKVFNRENITTTFSDRLTSISDSESEMLVQGALDHLMKDKTTFVIAHRLSTIRHADRIVVLKNGCLVETGTHDELIEKEGEYKKLYRIQFET